MKVVIWDDLAEVAVSDKTYTELFSVTERRHDGITTLEHAIELRMHAWPTSSTGILEKSNNIAAMKVIDRVFVLRCPFTKNEIRSLMKDDREYECL